MIHHEYDVPVTSQFLPGLLTVFEVGFAFDELVEEPNSQGSICLYRSLLRLPTQVQSSSRPRVIYLILRRMVGIASRLRTRRISSIELNVCSC